METRLEKKDIVFIVACIAVATLSLIVGVHYFYRAFPEASIDFHVTREEARTSAESFLRARGFDVSDYRHSAIFAHDDRAKTFLERELGLEGATRAIGNPVRLWRWNHRWVRERQQEEYRVAMTTSGDLAGFHRHIEEARPGADLAESEARLLAEDFLIGTMQRERVALEFVGAQSSKREARTDYDFTWKLKGFSPAESSYRLRVFVQGDQVGGFDEFLHVPEAWQRDFDTLRSRNQATGMVASFLLMLTLLAMVVAFFSGVRTRDIRWKTALTFAAIASLLTLLSELNNLPLSVHGYDTTNTYTSFLAGQLFAALVTALGQGLFIFLLTAAAEPLYRRHYPGQISISTQFLAAGLRSKRFLLGSILGLAMTAFFFAYQTLFYIVAEHFGAWSPAQIPYSEMVNTYIPWIVVLLIGFMPAVSEEFMSRAFSIPFLQRYLKSPSAAVVVSALIWGFAHAGYPQQPFYIRGLEVGIAGILIGFIFLRWGLLAPLVWHYTVDALYTALILLRSSNSYFVTSAAISAGLVLLPLAAAIVLYARHRRFSDPQPLLNGSEKPQSLRGQPSPLEKETIIAAVPAEASFDFAAPAWSRTQRAITTLLCVVSLLVFFVDWERPFDFVEYRITAAQAQARAEDHLRAQGADPSTYQIAVVQKQQPNHEAIRYSLQRDGLEYVNRLYRQNLLASLWGVRFFRYGEKEEYLIAVDPQDGSIYSQRHVLSEENAGAKLSEEAARILADEALRACDIDPLNFDVVEASSTERPARMDHHFIYQARDGDPRNRDELYYRISIDLSGDEVSGFYRHLKVPEAWTRQRSEDSYFKTACSGLLVSLVFALTLHALWLLVRFVRRDAIDWRGAYPWAAAAILLSALAYGNNMSTMVINYDTRLSLSVFAITQTLMAGFGLLGIVLFAFAAHGLITGAFPDWRIYLRTATTKDAFADALLRALLFTAASLSLGHLMGLARSAFITDDPNPAFVLPGGLDSHLPFLSGLTQGLLVAFLVPLALATLVYYSRYLAANTRSVLLLVFAFCIIAAGARGHDAVEFTFALVSNIASASAIIALCFYFLRTHLMAYLLAAFVTVIIKQTHILVSLQAPLYQMHGIALLLAAILCILYLWRRALSQRLF
ncbi:MAG: membrane protease YdiL (CAAX protease family) [Candidatus Latescibacterota bacterium]|jgi:membrane protease YdiL (CAAX protease family)